MREYAPRFPSSHEHSAVPNAQQPRLKLGNDSSNSSLAGKGPDLVGISQFK
jgi:hypothetical protein